MAETNWKSAPGPSEVAAYNSKRTAFQQAGTFANQNYDPTAEGSFELKSRLYTDPAAYSFAINNWVSGWRNDTTSVPNSNFKNRLDYIQFLLRGSGLSTEKGGVSRGILTVKDLAGLRNASQIALANGIGFEDVMLSIYQSKQAAGGDGGPKYSKQMSTSLKLLDLGDATNKLSTAYFNMFGVYPTEENIKSFKTYWNTEARAQVGTVTTSQVTEKGKVKVGKKTGTGKVSTTDTVTKGYGFTEEEQAQTMANYLAKQFNVDPSKMMQGGAVKRVYDGIREIYRNNLLQEPAFESVAGVIKDLLSTPDETAYTTKLTAIQQGVRDKAAKFYPTLAEDLKNGKNISEYSDVYYELLANTWGVTSASALKSNKDATALVQNAFNYTDAKGNVRMQNLTEFLASARNSKNYLEGSQAIAGAGRLGDKIIAAMGGGR